MTENQKPEGSPAFRVKTKLLDSKTLVILEAVRVLVPPPPVSPTPRSSSLSRLFLSIP